MKRFGLRGLLPAFQLVLYVALLSAGLPEEMELRRRWAGLWDAPYSVPYAWATGINFPVSLLVGLSAGAIRAMRATGPSWEPWEAILTGCLALPFWYWIGKRFDQAFGFLPPRAAAQRVPDRGLLIGLCITAVCFIGLLGFMHREYLIEAKLCGLTWIIFGFWAVGRGGSPVDGCVAR